MVYSGATFGLTSSTFGTQRQGQQTSTVRISLALMLVLGGGIGNAGSGFGGVGPQLANGMVVEPIVHHQGRLGRNIPSDAWKDLKSDVVPEVAEPVQEFGSDDDVQDTSVIKRRTTGISKRYQPTYNEKTGLCVCDGARSYQVPQIPDEQKLGYCVQICGPELNGVASTGTTPTPTSTKERTPTTTTAPVITSEAVTKAPSATTTSDSNPGVTVSTTIVSVTVSTTPPTSGDVNSQSSIGKGPSGGKDDNTGLKIGVGVAVGIIVSGMIVLALWIYLRRRKSQSKARANTLGEFSLGNVDGPGGERRGEKYIYTSSTTPMNASTHTVLNGAASTGTGGPQSPESIPPAYSGPGGTLPVPSSTNSSSTSIDTNPPVLPLGAPSRVLDLNGSGARSSFVPGDLTAARRQHRRSGSGARRNNPNTSSSSVAGSTGAVTPASITFFLHPVKNDKSLEEEEIKWLDEEQRRIREKKEAVEELNKLREEEEKIREKIRARERLRSGQ